MIEHIRTLQKMVNDLQGAICKIKSKQVYQRKIIETSKTIVDNYFRQIRDQIVNAGIDSNTISELDTSAHDLLEATHKKTTSTIYKKRVSKLRNLLVETEKLSLMAEGNYSRQFQLDLIDTSVIDTLKKIVPSAALSYEQALIDMQAAQRLSWRGPAADFREALRECLDYLAPDKEVMSVPGFKLETNANHPTMKQKTQYILQKRKLPEAAIKTAQDSVAIIDGLIGLFVRSVYSRASMSTHTPTDKKEVTRIRDLVRLVLCELLSVS
jgi:hypothetical protein